MTGLVVDTLVLVGDHCLSNGNLKHRLGRFEIANHLAVQLLDGDGIVQNAFTTSIAAGDIFATAACVVVGIKVPCINRINAGQVLVQRRGGSAVVDVAGRNQVKTQIVLPVR